MADTSPVDPAGGNYKPQFKASPEFRKFWQHLFQNTELTDRQVSQMTDQFVRNVWNQMNSVLQWALEEQKKRHQQEKEDQAGS